MSGNLKLKGATSGSSQISAPDTGTDEQFTFPATGGELVTGNAPGGGQVVGYQQGVWIPTVVEGSMTGVDPVWTRIGKQVTICARLKEFTTITGSSTITIQGLPYESADNDRGNTGSIMSAFLKHIPQCSYVTTAGNLNFFRAIEDSNWTSIKHDSIVSTNSSQILFTVSYFTDDTTWTPLNGATLT